MSATRARNGQRWSLVLAAVVGLGLAAGVVVGSAQLGWAGPSCPGSVGIPACPAPTTTTVPSTTIAPTTVPPATTAAPATVTPTTSVPATIAPPTVAPTAAAPTTVPETSVAPATSSVASVLSRQALPSTGTSPDAMLAASGLLVLGGAGVIVVTRRQRAGSQA